MDEKLNMFSNDYDVGYGCAVESTLFEPPIPRKIFDIERMAYFIAAEEAARFFINEMPMATNHFTEEQLLRSVMEAIRGRHGLLLEFGVGAGHSIRIMSEYCDQNLFGFDSFQGLPEAWSHWQPAGSYSQEGFLPKGLGDGVTILKGMFEETLPEFMKDHNEPILFAHIDCDLYSSTKCVLSHIGKGLAPGSILIFDEFFNYPQWRQHEYRAFKEFIELTGTKFEYIGFASSAMAVAVRILEV